jgi:hypothetical protein
MKGDIVLTGRPARKRRGFLHLDNGARYVGYFAHQRHISGLHEPPLGSWRRLFPILQQFPGTRGVAADDVDTQLLTVFRKSAGKSTRSVGSDARCAAGEGDDVVVVVVVG